MKSGTASTRLQLTAKTLHSAVGLDSKSPSGLQGILQTARIESTYCPLCRPTMDAELSRSIQSRYYELAQKHHADASGSKGKDEEMKAVNEAYHSLKNRMFF